MCNEWDIYRVLFAFLFKQINRGDKRATLKYAAWHGKRVHEDSCWGSERENKLVASTLIGSDTWFVGATSQTQADMFVNKGKQMCSLQLFKIRRSYTFSLGLLSSTSRANPILPLNSS